MSAIKKKYLLSELPRTPMSDLQTLVENRRAYTLNEFELNVYETYENSSRVPLQFDDIVIINMIKGRKVMHLKDYAAFDYLPGETLVLPALTQMQIDFPEAELESPTQCTALVISSDKIIENLTYLQEHYPKLSGRFNWTLDLQKLRLDNTQSLSRVTDRLFEVMTSNDPFKDALADLVLKELMVRIIQHQTFDETHDPTKNTGSIISYLRQYIRRNIGEKISIEDLSKAANMSKATLFRMFKNELGISPIELVITERILLAKKMLRQVVSVKEVAYSCGFNDVNYFVRLFRSREQMTPGAYRDQFRASAS